MHVNEQQTKKKIQQIILKHCFSLIQQVYGNYTIQAVLDVRNFYHQCFDYEFNQQFFKILSGKLTMLSMQKYSSTVIEKCLEKGGDSFLANFIEEISLNNKISGNEIFN